MCEALNTVFVSLSIGPVSIYVVKGWLACWAIDYKRLLAQQQDLLSLVTREDLSPASSLSSLHNNFQTVLQLFSELAIVYNECQKCCLFRHS